MICHNFIPIKSGGWGQKVLSRPSAKGKKQKSELYGEEEELEEEE
jgi:hypothetical protein